MCHHHQQQQWQSTFGNIGMYSYNIVFVFIWLRILCVCAYDLQRYRAHNHASILIDRSIPRMRTMYFIWRRLITHEIHELVAQH